MMIGWITYRGHLAAMYKLAQQDFSQEKLFDTVWEFLYSVWNSVSLNKKLHILESNPVGPPWNRTVYSLFAHFLFGFLTRRLSHSCTWVRSVMWLKPILVWQWDNVLGWIKKDVTTLTSEYTTSSFGTSESCCLIRKSSRSISCCKVSLIALRDQRFALNSC